MAAPQYSQLADKISDSINGSKQRLALGSFDPLVSTDSGSIAHDISFAKDYERQLLERELREVEKMERHKLLQRSHKLLEDERRRLAQQQAELEARAARRLQLEAEAAQRLERSKLEQEAKFVIQVEKNRLLNQRDQFEAEFRERAHRAQLQRYRAEIEDYETQLAAENEATDWEEGPTQVPSAASLRALRSPGPSTTFPRDLPKSPKGRRPFSTESALPASGGLLDGAALARPSRAAKPQAAPDVCDMVDLLRRAGGKQRSRTATGDTHATTLQHSGHPVVILKIDVGGGVVDNLVVNEDDDPYDLAVDLVQRHGLNPAVIDPLAQRIEQQLQVLALREELAATESMRETLSPPHFRRFQSQSASRSASPSTSVRRGFGFTPGTPSPPRRRRHPHACDCSESCRREHRMFVPEINPISRRIALQRKIMELGEPGPLEDTGYMHKLGLHSLASGDLSGSGLSQRRLELHDLLGESPLAFE
eukprot:TRINITY_DN95439_c0_g1_i1.p1 TRINITY_DN95439_c0_g1~~TRINITY_DN95439_c0_g1_i1.p1  ORF type:complete len:480 (+),score=88.14 TRINITY_DN95439_c0_g1_i1:47-1486(+)